MNGHGCVSVKLHLQRMHVPDLAQRPTPEAEASISLVDRQFNSQTWRSKIPYPFELKLEFQNMRAPLQGGEAPFQPWRTGGWGDPGRRKLGLQSVGCLTRSFLIWTSSYGVRAGGGGEKGKMGKRGGQREREKEEEEQEEEGEKEGGRGREGAGARARARLDPLTFRGGCTPPVP